jgi:hypothetical protein
MLKFTSIALGLLTLVSIVPSAQAFPIVIGDTRNSQPEVKVIINPQTKTESHRDNNYNSYQSYHERQEAQRRREREARREAWYRRHHGYSSNNNYNRDSSGRYEDKSGYYNNRDRH